MFQHVLLCLLRMWDKFHHVLDFKTINLLNYSYYLVLLRKQKYFSFVSVLVTVLFWLAVLGFLLYDIRVGTVIIFISKLQQVETCKSFNQFNVYRYIYFRFCSVIKI
jgi:hypothetical protein